MYSASALLSVINTNRRHHYSLLKETLFWPCFFANYISAIKRLFGVTHKICLTGAPAPRGGFVPRREFDVA